MFQIKHLAMDKRHHTARAQRAGHGMDIILESGTRVKQRGGRPTVVGASDIQNSFSKLIESVVSGLIEITCPDGYVLSPDMVQGDKIQPIVDEFKKHLGAEDVADLELNMQHTAPDDMVRSDTTHATPVPPPVDKTPEKPVTPAEPSTAPPAKESGDDGSATRSEPEETPFEAPDSSEDKEDPKLPEKESKHDTKKKGKSPVSGKRK